MAKPGAAYAPRKTKSKRPAPLQRKAAQIGAALLLFLGTGLLLRFAGDGICGLIAKGASLSNPAGVPGFAVELIRLCILFVSLGLPLLFLRYACGLPLCENGSPLRRVNGETAAVWTGLFLPVIVAAVFLSSFLRFLLQSVFSAAPASGMSVPEGGFALFFSFLTVCALPAFFEELLFRGCIQTAFLPYGPRFAVLTTSLLFTLLHADVTQLPGTFLLSYFLGWAAAATGGYALSMTLHLLYNGTAFILTYTGQHMMQAAGPMLAVILLVLYFMIGLSVFFTLRRSGRLPAGLARVKDPRNRQSRLELLLTSPGFSISLLALVAYWVLRQLI
ncbi:MAG: type II CAAX endopeptidase family protein [Oscillospiraceae bacterium]|nr:type II CAAX endopeptidase family protein [Oscillospiraceae bacterium]